MSSSSGNDLIRTWICKECGQECKTPYRRGRPPKLCDFCKDSRGERSLRTHRTNDAARFRRRQDRKVGRDLFNTVHGINGAILPDPLSDREMDDPAPPATSGETESGVSNRLIAAIEADLSSERSPVSRTPSDPAPALNAAARTAFFERERRKLARDPLLRELRLPSAIRERKYPYRPDAFFERRGRRD